jgi:hypothetical protein
MMMMIMMIINCLQSSRNVYPCLIIINYKMQFNAIMPYRGTKMYKDKNENISHIVILREEKLLYFRYVIVIII